MSFFVCFIGFYWKAVRGRRETHELARCDALHGLYQLFTYKKRSRKVQTFVTLGFPYIKFLTLYHTSTLLSRTFVRNIFSTFPNVRKTCFGAFLQMQLRLNRSDRLGLHLPKTSLFIISTRARLPIFVGAMSKLSPRDIYYRHARKTWRFAKR